MQEFSEITFVIIFELCVCCLLFCTLFGRSTGRPGRPLADVRFLTGTSVPSLTLSIVFLAYCVLLLLLLIFRALSRKIIEREEAVYQ